MEVCCGGILGMGETLEKRAEFAPTSPNSTRRGAAELPQPRPGTPFGDLGRVARGRGAQAAPPSGWQCRAHMLRFAGGRRSHSATSAPSRASSAESTPSYVGNLPDHAGRPAEAEFELLTTCRCRSRRSTRPSSDGPKFKRLHRPNPTARRVQRLFRPAARLGLEPPRFCEECGRGGSCRSGPTAGRRSARGTACWTPRTSRRGDGASRAKSQNCTDERDGRAPMTSAAPRCSRRTGHPRRPRSAGGRRRRRAVWAWLAPRSSRRPR